MILICTQVAPFGANFLASSITHYFVSFSLDFFLLMFLPQSLNYTEHIDLKFSCLVMLKMLGIILKS
jgi:hypothetical protein